MSDQSFYFEMLSFKSFVQGFLIRKSYKVNHLYYIDSKMYFRKIFIPLFGMFGYTFEKIEFEMRYIHDVNGELIRLKIPRIELFEIQEKIIESDAWKVLYNKSWEQGSLVDYIKKGLIDGGVMDSSSISRMLFIIEIVRWHNMRNNKFSYSVFIVNKRPWFFLYTEYAQKYKIDLLEINDSDKYSMHIRNFIRRHPRLYRAVKNLKYNGLIAKSKITKSSGYKLYLDGRRDVNFDNDGEHSDFFWQLNSEFPVKNIIYKYYTDEEKKYLSKYDILSVGEGIASSKTSKRNYLKPTVRYSFGYRKEYINIKSLLESYDLDRFYWGQFFKSFNAKLFLSWYKYTKDHMALSDAIDDSGGISVVWQMAFDGFKTAECVVNLDVLFCYSTFSNEIEIEQKSKIKYNVVIGYPKDYVAPLLRARANLLREKLKLNGAKKIVFVIDENSIDDSRWHTGHKLQQENYSYILEKLLETPWLGVIFKPKAANTLRKRLGSFVNNLLTKAESTGRCYVYEASGRYTTSAPPILAGLSADICIHGHLSSGTAALECALENLPTLLIDREGCPTSKLYDLPQGKVIFKNWPDTIDALMKHFNSPNGIDGFGDWSSIIDDLDPFRDGNAAKRMGDYLNWLLEGYEHGLDKEINMQKAAERYMKQWGEDKVLSA